MAGKMASITAFSNSGEEVIRRKLESCSIKRRAKTKEEITSYYEIDRCVEFAKKYETVSYLHIITHTQTWSSGVCGYIVLVARY